VDVGYAVLFGMVEGIVDVHVEGFCGLFVVLLSVVDYAGWAEWHQAVLYMIG
jgi:hypothetical protein